MDIALLLVRLIGFGLAADVGGGHKNARRENRGDQQEYSGCDRNQFPIHLRYAGLDEKSSAPFKQPRSRPRW